MSASLKHTDEQIKAWAEKHGINLSGADLRAAFEDAFTSVPNCPACGDSSDVIRHSSDDQFYCHQTHRID